MEYRISVLIPVFNELKYTQMCLENLHDAMAYFQDRTEEAWPLEIIVIDDGSTDGTSAWIQQHYPDVTLLYGDGNLFWSAGINKGIEYAINQSPKPTHILFWNKDLYIEEDYFNILQRLIWDNGQETIIASKMFRKSTPDILFSFGGLYRPWTDTKINIGTGIKDGPAYSEKREIDWCGGMAVSIPTKVFESIGLCDSENFPQYDGDTDLFLRAGKAGFKIEVNPELKAWNVHENTGRKEQFTFKNLKWYLNNIRSYKNFRIGYSFMRKHSIGPLAYVLFFGRQFVFVSKYIFKIVLDVRK